MIKDLRTFLENWEKKHPEDILRIEKEISAKWEITALQTKLEKMGKFPIIICEKPINVQGKKSDHCLVTNITASRRRCATILGITPEKVAMEYGEKAASRGRPLVISRKGAPVKDVIEKGDQVNLDKFPVVWHHEMDPGPYISGGIVTTYDPDTGINNCSFQRLWAKTKEKTGYHPLPTHNWNNMLKFWRAGEDAPVAIWIGHHPAALLGGNVKLGYPESHYPAMCGLLGEPIRLVPTETFGEELLVPAASEIVIEGVIPKDTYEPEGPFGEYSGVYDGQRPNPIIEVKCITYRKDAIYYHIGAGKADHQIMGVFPIEAGIFEAVKRVVPELMNVHLPLSGCCRFHVYLQIKKTKPGIGIDAILATMPVHWSIRHVFVFDDDIDIFNERDVLWALATRSYVGGWIQLPSPLFGYKGGIDCTKPAPPAPSLPSIAPARVGVPNEVWERIKVEDYMEKTKLDRIPSG